MRIQIARAEARVVFSCVLPLFLSFLLPPPLVGQDDHSQSRPDVARVTHARIDWTVDFESKALRGHVLWTVVSAHRNSEASVILDTKALTIIETSTSGDGTAFQKADARTLPQHPVFGTALVVPLPAGHRFVKVEYATTEASSGLQWLEPSQTAGGKLPFLFSQAQAIHARSMLPCQDTPGVRFTYDATIRVKDGLFAAMAAKSLPRGDDGSFRFQMLQPIPSYLVALAVGDLAFQKLGERTGVYAEPSVLARAAHEFADTETMIAKAESLYGPYRWERYDLVVLPPSFPFGGMENPRLTFATPTVLAGDRSLVALIAHELAHSWSGNLVTNATWSDFWLNEGFTVYFERRIQEAVFGKARAEMEAMLGRAELLEEMKSLPPGDTILHVDLKGRDPDDAFSNVPYEKGYLLLRKIEELMGRERFDPLLRKWFEKNAFQSKKTADFVAHLEREWLSKDPRAASELLLREWLYEPGLPSNAPSAKSDAFERTENAAREFVSGKLAANKIPAAEWTFHEWSHFLHSLPEDLPVEKIATLDLAYGLSKSGNSEILAQWLQIAIRRGYEPAMPALESFLTSQGRRKFLKPLYTELCKTEAGRKRALAIYERARPLYHAIARGTIDTIVGKAP